MLAGEGPDNYCWDEENQRFRPGSDGNHEVNLYPLDLPGGNFGTVDIGSNSSSTPDLRRQIRTGITPADLAFHGGAIRLDENGRTIVYNP